MEQSESITNLAGALAKAQGELKAAEMTAENPFLHNRYADLGEVIKASRPALAKYGLSFIQPVSFADGRVIITTQLMHESGEWVREVMAFPVSEAKGKSAVQEAGSVITYLRRYSLSSMLGIYADADTDGSETKPTQPARTNGKQVIPQPPDELPVVEREAPTNAAQPWPNDTVQAVAREYGINANQARNTLNLSALNRDSSIDEALGWVKMYRAHRAEKREPQEAAELTNENYHGVAA